MYVAAILKPERRTRYYLKPGEWIHSKDLEILTMSQMLGDVKATALVACKETNEKVLILRDYSRGHGRYLKLKMVVC